VSTAHRPAPATYRNGRAYPFCPGCGHTRVLERLDEALVASGRDPREVVIVSDIGCSGLADQYFVTDAFHGLHGRSITYATGIKLARPDLTVIVVMGDGGTGIGGAHLLAAARRNVGLTVIVLDNLNFGMTGGQHSPTTPDGARTATTPDGNLERPLDLCATVGVNGAAFACRATSSDADLAARIGEAIGCDGFALLDVWGPCTAHYASRNASSRRHVQETLARLGFATGVVHRADRPEFARALADAAARAPEPAVPAAVAACAPASLESTLRVVVAGSAGAKVRSAARLAAHAALLSGLHVSQRDDYPVTVQTGHCVSSLVIAPEEIRFSGIDLPDVLVVLSETGLARVAARLARLPETARVFSVPGIVLPPTRARVTVVDVAAVPPRQLSLHVLATALLASGAPSRDALLAAASALGDGRAEAASATVRAAAP